MVWKQKIGFRDRSHFDVIGEPYSFPCGTTASRWLVPTPLGYRYLSKRDTGTVTTRPRISKLTRRLSDADVKKKTKNHRRNAVRWKYDSHTYESEQ